MSITLHTNGAVLRIEDHASARNGPYSLLFLHYWGGSAATWRRVIADLDGEVRCVAVNQRGWGGSHASDDQYDLRRMADDVLAIIAHLRLNHVILVAHSMGAKVAQIVAKAKRPEVCGLVLIAPAPPSPMPVTEEVRQSMLQSYQSVEGVRQALKVLAGSELTPDELEAVIADTLAGESGAKQEWTDRGMVTDLNIDAGDIQIPVTLLVGSNDKVEDPGRLHAIFGEVIPQTRFTDVPNAGHLLPLEAPKAIASACRDMLAAIAL